MYLSQVTTCPGIDIALEEGFDQAGKAGFGVLHASQLVGHAARLLYFIWFTSSISHNYIIAKFITLALVVN